MSLLSTRINLDAISHNVRRLKELVGPDVRLMCVVKAGAYGHGVEEVGPVMLKAGADVVGCATVDEAVSLRSLGIGGPLVAWMWEAEEDHSDAGRSNTA